MISSTTGLTRPKLLLATTGIALSLVVAACGGGDDQTASTPATSDQQAEPSGEALGIRLVTPQEGAEIQAEPPQDLVILDVRTPEEFAEGRLEGAIMIDFYEADFADQLAELDPNVPYLLYCRSGNRSGQAAAVMEQLGFTDVSDIDGGILSWSDAGLPLVK